MRRGGIFLSSSRRGYRSIELSWVYRLMKGGARISAFIAQEWRGSVYRLLPQYGIEVRLDGRRERFLGRELRVVVGLVDRRRWVGREKGGDGVHEGTGTVSAVQERGA